MDAVVYVDEAFDEDFDESLEILPELKAIADCEQHSGASSSSLPGSDVAGSEIASQPIDSDARTTSTSPVDDRSVDDHRSIRDTCEVAASEEGAPTVQSAQPTTSVAVQTLYNLPETGREEVELELASLGVLIQQCEEHRRIVLIEQVEVREDDSDSDSENEAVVLTAVPAADMTAHTRAQANIWLSISRYWANGSWRGDASVGSSREPPASPERHGLGPHDRRAARRDERSRSNSPDRHDFSNAVNGALQMALARAQPK